LHNADAAKALFEQLVREHPDSAEAARAKAVLARP
jgi:TolA-binding protein